MSRETPDKSTNSTKQRHLKKTVEIKKKKSCDKSQGKNARESLVETEQSGTKIKQRPVANHAHRHTSGKKQLREAVGGNR